MGAMRGLFKQCLEMGPLVLFFIWYKKQGLEAALFPFMMATGFSLVLMWGIFKKVNWMMVFGAFVLMIFGGLTLYLDNKLFFYMKPTILYVIFSLVLWGGVLRGRIFLKSVFGTMMALSDAAWVQLTARFCVFFVCMALCNELVWRSLSEQAWVMMKVFGFTAVTMVFMGVQLVWVQRQGGLKGG